MNVPKTIFRLLTFRLTRDEMLQLNWRHFLAGLLGTWIVGMGRYWDHKNASLLQHLGFGSIIYIFILAGFIWLIVKPYFVEDWNYLTVVTFIGLTSFPAILYAIPVEKYYPIQTADSINAYFLLVVAIWRLCLLYYFLKKFTRLGIGSIFTITLMPICLIITTLSELNLDHVVYNIMSGIEHPSPNDSSYLIIWLLSGISAIIILPLLIAYFVGIYFRYQKRKRK
jgi:hypothetical protein